MAILACLGVGLVVAAFYLQAIVLHPHAARIVDGHIVYASESKVSYLMGSAYLIATGAAMALSSHRAMIALSVIVIGGAYLSYMLYWESFVSVWCFFAAAASVVVVLHFEREYRRSLRAAAT